LCFLANFSFLSQGWHATRVQTPPPKLCSYDEFSHHQKWRPEIPLSALIFTSQFSPAVAIEVSTPQLPDARSIPSPFVLYLFIPLVVKDPLFPTAPPPFAADILLFLLFFFEMPALILLAQSRGCLFFFRDLLIYRMIEQIAFLLYCFRRQSPALL